MPKAIVLRERLIFALDVATVDEARALVEKLGDSVWFYKLGLQLFMAGGYFELVEWLRARDKQVFVDLKFFDVPETVKAAAAQLKHRDVAFATVHGNDAMLEAAVLADSGVKVLAVTALTSLDRGDLADLGFDCEVKQLVLSRARRALQLGCAGVISSGLEAADLRAELGANFLVVTPGIRPVDNNTVDDQKRTTSITQAFEFGADYIVVGRPIRNAPDPHASAALIQHQIASIFAAA